MEWLYYIPHVWDSPEDKALWEDVYLMPKKGWKDKKERVSIWLTVDGLGEKPPEDDPYDEMKYYLENIEEIGDKEYVIDRKHCNMLINKKFFNLHELLEYTKIFIKEIFNDQNPILVEGTIEDFAGTNEHAGIVEGIGTRLKEEFTKKDEDKKKPDKK